MAVIGTGLIPKALWGDRSNMGKLSAADRRSLPSSDFALPGKGAGPGGKGSGSYPVPDVGHAKAALSMVSRYGNPTEKEAVRQKVAVKFPGLEQDEAHHNNGGPAFHDGRSTAFY